MPGSEPVRHIGAKAIGLIMAGGHSARMRSSLGPAHKALVPVLGIPLLERNICALVANGIRHIVVATNQCEREIHEYVRGRATSLLATVGGAIDYVEETEPLGTIGAVGQLASDSFDSVVVANADNLTTLPWRDMLSFHQDRQAAMTVAAHLRQFRSPFGELAVNDGKVVEYHEKPLKQALISSGCYVIDYGSCRLIAPGRRADAPELVNLLLDAGRLVAAFEHQRPWIDINDASAVEDAERLVARHFTDFECWHPSPQAQRIQLLVSCDGRILTTARRSGDSSADWQLPETSIHNSVENSAVELFHNLGFEIQTPCLLGSYDDFDHSTGIVTRQHLFYIAASQPGVPIGSEHRWIPLENCARDQAVSSVVRRAAGLLKNQT